MVHWPFNRGRLAEICKNSEKPCRLCPLVALLAMTRYTMIIDLPNPAIVVTLRESNRSAIDSRSLSRYTKVVSRKALAAGNSPAKTGG